MRKIRIAALAAFFVPVIFLAGCASMQGPDHAAASFSATAAKVCAVVQPTIASVQAQATLLSPPLSADDQAKLTGASAAVGTFCGTTATATSATAQGMLNATIPVVSGIIANSSLSASSRNAFLLSLAGVQTAANILIAQAEASRGAVSQ
ncbi:hypothetical protein [Castellaniella sp. UC4442_H9]